jgi:hypothetical protein
LLTQGYCAAAEDQQAAQDLSAKHITAKQALDESQGSDIRSWMYHFKDLEEHPERYLRDLSPQAIPTTTSRFQGWRWDEQSQQWDVVAFPRGEERFCTDRFVEKEQAVRACRPAAVEAQGTVENAHSSSSQGRIKHIHPVIVALSWLWHLLLQYTWSCIVAAHAHNNQRLAY